MACRGVLLAGYARAACGPGRCEIQAMKDEIGIGANCLVMDVEVRVEPVRKNPGAA
jgi:hypothetical protein